MITGFCALSTLTKVNKLPPYIFEKIELKLIPYLTAGWPRSLSCLNMYKGSFLSFCQCAEDIETTVNAGNIVVVFVVSYCGLSFTFFWLSSAGNTVVLCVL